MTGNDILRLLQSLTPEQRKMEVKFPAVPFGGIPCSINTMSIMPADNNWNLPNGYILFKEDDDLDEENK